MTTVFGPGRGSARRTANVRACQGSCVGAREASRLDVRQDRASADPGGTYDVTSVVRLSPRRPVPVRRFPPQTVTRIARLLARSMAFAPNLARRRTFIRARSRNAVSISVRLADARSALPSRLSPAEALTTPSRWWTARTSRWLASATVVNLLGLQL